VKVTLNGYRVRFSERNGQTIATCHGYIGTANGSGEDAKHDALDALDASVRRFAAMGDGMAAIIAGAKTNAA
jgi:uncharacterized protein YegP (UPF0339 family)